MLPFFKDNWQHLVQVAAWLGSLIGQYWRTPPARTLESDSQLASFGQFTLTLAVGLLAIPVSRYGERRHTLPWAIVGAVLLVLCIATFLFHEHLFASWAVPYRSKQLIIGPDSALTSHGKQYRQDHAEETNAQIVFDHSGKAEDIWTTESIEGRRWIMELLYLSSLPLFAAAMIAVTQAVACNTRPAPP